jgi:hypothetical protein
MPKERIIRRCSPEERAAGGSVASQGFDTLQGPPPAFSGSGDASRANALIGGSTQNHEGLDESLAL